MYEKAEYQNGIGSVSIPVANHASAFRYLTTLRRIPSETFLFIFGAEFNPNSGQQCICGWALRADCARIRLLPEFRDAWDVARTVLDVDSTYYDTSIEIPAACAVRWGGTVEEWNSLFVDVMEDALTDGPAIELAVTMRLDEIVLGWEYHESGVISFPPGTE